MIPFLNKLRTLSYKSNKIHTLENVENSLRGKNLYNVSEFYDILNLQI